MTPYELREHELVTRIQNTEENLEFKQDLMDAHDRDIDLANSEMVHALLHYGQMILQGEEEFNRCLPLQVKCNPLFQYNNQVLDYQNTFNELRHDINCANQMKREIREEMEDLTPILERSITSLVALRDEGPTAFDTRMEKEQQERLYEAERQYAFSIYFHPRNQLARRGLRPFNKDPWPRSEDASPSYSP